METQQSIALIVETARRKGHRIATNRDGLQQIDFGHKKLHAGHLRAMLPEILRDGASIAGIIERVAPGRPCTHKPMKEIIREVRNRTRHLVGGGMREDAA